MYRPNRIGPHPVLDFEIGQTAWPTDWNTNFNGPDSSITSQAVYPQVLSATVPEDYGQVAWSAEDASIQLSTLQQVAWGVPVSGTATNDLGNLWSCAGSLVIGDASAAGLSARFFIGRANVGTLSVTRTSAQNEILRPYELRSAVTMDGDSLHAGFQGSVVNEASSVGGGDFGTNPVIFGVALANSSGANITLAGIWISLSLHKYIEDLKTFEDAR